jgi:hypothetical protein
MKLKSVVAAVVVAAIAAGSAFAQSEEMYVSKSGEKWMFHGGTAPAEGTEILQGEAGAKPANCPAGSYWLNDKQMIASCDTADVFGFAKIPAGQKTASGQDFPADSYLVQKDGMSMTDVSK